MRIVRTMAAVLGLVASAAFVAPASAQATPIEAGVPVSSGLVPVYDVTDGKSKLVSPAAAKSIITNYWTAERLAAAIPAPTPVVEPEEHSAAPEPSGAPMTLTEPVARTVSDGIHAQVSRSRAAGKVVYYDPVKKANYACSGATVASPKKRLVVTAAQCVHTGGPGGRWMENWAFYPGYHDGPGPAGIFPFRRALAPQWTHRRNFQYDYTFVITQTNAAGRRVVDAVGGNGIIWNARRSFVTAFAYPSTVNYQRQMYCQRWLSAMSSPFRHWMLDCDMRHGEGGPWLRNYSDTSQLGYIVSNQSYQLRAGGPVYGPYYDTAIAKGTFQAAEWLSP